MTEIEWTIYLSGEIHTDWREQIISACEAKDLPVSFVGPVTVHEDSDDCGVVILGEEDNPFWRDQKGARMNAIRTRTLMESADLVVVRFGEKYKQWNAAFDAGYAAALNTPYITLHDPALTHALKEVDGAALATAQDPLQVAKIIEYVTTGRLQRH